MAVIPAPYSIPRGDKLSANSQGVARYLLMAMVAIAIGVSAAIATVG